MQITYILCIFAHLSVCVCVCAGLDGLHKKCNQLLITDYVTIKVITNIIHWITCNLRITFGLLHWFVSISASSVYAAHQSVPSLKRNQIILYLSALEVNRVMLYNETCPFDTKNLMKCGMIEVSVNTGLSFGYKMVLSKANLASDFK